MQHNSQCSGCALFRSAGLFTDGQLKTADLQLTALWTQGLHVYGAETCPLGPRLLRRVSELNPVHWGERFLSSSRN